MRTTRVTLGVFEQLASRCSTPWTAGSISFSLIFFLLPIMKKGLATWMTVAQPAMDAS